MQKESGKFGISDKRGRCETSSDPYIQAGGLPEPTLCTGCRAVYRRKRWYLDEEAYEKFSTDAEVARQLCPACRKIADGYAEGYVTLRGSYLWTHEEEIRNILRNEETKARAKNPLERIIRMERDGDALLIETTEEKLAEHLGRALNKSHQGELKVVWTDDHAICRVTWQREG
jgi:NMD protein affecting ribosome stability and mRNA decay